MNSPFIFNYCLRATKDTCLQMTERIRRGVLVVEDLLDLAVHYVEPFHSAWFPRAIPPMVLMGCENSSRLTPMCLRIAAQDL
jgi:hypothetical protein